MRDNWVIVNGLALRFVLLLCDKRVSDAHHAACQMNTISLSFDTADITVELERHPPDQLLCRFSTTLRTSASDQLLTYKWQRVIPGPIGCAAQREEILREINRARRTPVNEATPRA